MKKKRLNWGALVKGLLFVSSLLYILDTFYELAIKPFFTLESVGLTTFGFISTIIAFICLNNSIEYFKERLGK